VCTVVYSRVQSCASCSPCDAHRVRVHHWIASIVCIVSTVRIASRGCVRGGTLAVQNLLSSAKKVGCGPGVKVTGLAQNFQVGPIF
jgi:hypothetical protein